MPIDLHSSITNLMMRAIRSATKSIYRDFAELDLLQNSKAGTLRFATNARNKIRKNLVEELVKAKKDCYIYDEENVKVYGDPSYEHRFLIVGIDNFASFMHAIPFFATGIAYQKLNHKGEYETLSIVIDVPVQREFYYCEKGRGAWREIYTEGNTKPTRLRVSERKLPDEILVNNPNMNLSGHSLGSIVMNSPLMDILYMALGKFDAITVNNMVFEPFLTIILESGGIIEERNGKIIARNAFLDAIGLA